MKQFYFLLMNALFVCSIGCTKTSIETDNRDLFPPKGDITRSLLDTTEDYEYPYTFEEDKEFIHSLGYDTAMFFEYNNRYYFSKFRISKDVLLTYREAENDQMERISVGDVREILYPEQQHVYIDCFC